ncbi:MAG TPA: DNA polymerase III subunit beta, partial [Novosphingobium sp.]|nr:DNA polymerase III subunit beta [Novosphingobium sp.]
MKATIERSTLLRCLSHVQSVVERRNTIPILSNVLIEAAAGGSLRIMATDLDLQVVESLGAVSVEQAGAITVSAHLLFDIARKLPEGSQVSLDAADNRMVVKAGRSRFQLPTLPRDDFPMIAEGELPTSFEIPAATLAQLIDRTRFAISTEETRYYLNGIFLHVTDEDLKAAATDGHRLTLPVTAFAQNCSLIWCDATNEAALIDLGGDIPGASAPGILRALGCEVTELYSEVDGDFPNHHPDPSKPENLQDLIKA